MDGVLVVDKPEGITSHDVVTRVRRLAGTRRVGHLGTLDPMATGVLPLVISRATRLASLLSSGAKVYQAVIVFGVVTDTYDITGTVLPPSGDQAVAVPNDLRLVETASARFVGTFSQTPPSYSAKKVDGVRAYRLARRRKPVIPNPVEVTVERLELQRLDGNRLRCRITSRSGFYVRSLAHDLGQALGCGGCLGWLRREQSGAFGLDEAVTIDELERLTGRMNQHLLPLDQLLPELPGVIVTENGARLTSHGNPVTSNDFKMHESGASELTDTSHVRVRDESGRLLAIARRESAHILLPRIVLV